MYGLRTLVAASAIGVLALGAAPAHAQAYYTYPHGYSYVPHTSHSRAYDQDQPTWNSPRKSGTPWSHYDRDDHFSVGGDGNGCYYAGDWSNC
jgi:hypothetical protein